MMSGTYVLTDTIDKAFSNLFSETYAETDARVTGAGPDINIDGETAGSPGISESFLDEIRAVPSVDVAAGGLVNEQTRILDKNGEAIAPDAPTFGFGIDVSPESERKVPPTETAFLATVRATASGWSPNSSQPGANLLPKNLT